MYQQQQQYQQPRFAGAAVSTPALLGQVLGIVGVGFGITALFSWLTASFALPGIVSLVAMLIGFGFLIGINMMRANAAASLFLFYAFTACEGIGIGPAIGSYTRTSGGSEIVFEAAITTGMGLVTLALVAFLGSFDYRKLSGIAFGALIALVIASLVGAFTHWIHPTVIAWATLAVFTLLTLIDFTRLKAGGDGLSPVQMAVSIYLDGINIFLALLRIFGSRRDD